MARAFCPNCGTEFQVPEKRNRNNMIDVTDMNVSGTLIPKEIHNNNVNKFEDKKENKTMMNLDMETLAKLVAAQIKNEVKEVAKTPTQTTVDGEQWAKTSKFYGKEICGYAYNPYLVRRFLPRQFMDMMDKFNLNVNEGIRCEYGYMKGIAYLIEECEKLAMLYKRDKITYDERSRFWSVSDCKKVFIKYADDVLTEIERLKKNCTLKTKSIEIPKRGEISVTVTETIKDHRIELLVTLDSDVEKELEMLKANLEKCWSYKEIANKMKAFKLIPIDGNRITIYRWDYTNHKQIVYHTYNRLGYELPKEFVKGFKKSGAYYTLKNLIMFEGVTFKGRTGREAVAYLRSLLDNGTEDYVFYAMLKEVLDK